MRILSTTRLGTCRWVQYLAQSLPTTAPGKLALEASRVGGHL
jgi:hypothetical protein